MNLATRLRVAVANTRTLESLRNAIIRACEEHEAGVTGARPQTQEKRMPEHDWIEELRQVTEQDTSVTHAAVQVLSTGLDKIEEAVDEAENAEEPDFSQVREYISQLRSNTDALAQAIAARTPAAPAEPQPEAPIE